MNGEKPVPVLELGDSARNGEDAEKRRKWRQMKTIRAMSGKVGNIILFEMRDCGK